MSKISNKKAIQMGILTVLLRSRYTYSTNRHIVIWEVYLRDNKRNNIMWGISLFIIGIADIINYFRQF